jgi:hypothetical protein
VLASQKARCPEDSPEEGGDSGLLGSSSPCRALPWVRRAAVVMTAHAGY